MPSWGGLEPLADRATLFSCCACLAAINAVSPTLASSFRNGDFFAAAINLGGVSVILWFALWAIVTIASEPGDLERAGRADGMVALGLVALALLPSAVAGALAVLIGGAFLLHSSARGTRAHRIGMIMLALTGSLIWGRLLLIAVAPPLLFIDAAIVGWLANVPNTGAVVNFAGTGTAFIVGPGCSSLHNMSLAVILWATLVQLLKLRITAPLVAVCAGGMAVMLAVNELRLAAIALHPADFVYLHEGVGAQLFGWASMIAAGLTIGTGIAIHGARIEPN